MSIVDLLINVLRFSDIVAIVTKKFRNISIILHLLVWSTIFSLPLMFKTSGLVNSSSESGAVLYFGCINIINAGLFYFNVYFLSPKLLKKKQWMLYAFTLLGVIAVFSLIKLIAVGTLFKDFALDELAYRFAIFSTIGFLIVSTLFSMALDSIRLEREQKELLAERLSAELKFYRSQVSPHFLFNVLSTLISLGRKGSEMLEPSLIMLSELMRYMLYETNETRVEIQKEVDYLKCYIALQQLRFGHDDVKIESNLRISENTNGLTIEPMLLIPFVENAFKHGIGWVQQPTIKIDLDVRDSILNFSVQNKYFDNPGISKDNNSGIGLANIRSRLNLLYADKHKLLITKIRKVPFLNLAKAFKNPLEASETLRSEKIDLIFLDIQMPHINGLQFIKSLPDPPMIILVTAYQEYALEGYDLNVIDYLLKPVSFDRFLKACNKAQELYQLKHKELPQNETIDHFFVNVEYTSVRINIADILYIEALKDYIKIFTATSARPVITKISIKSIEEKLPGHLFTRIHKSFVISINKVKSIKRDFVCIADKEIPIGEVYKDNVHKILKL
jgi:two-component system, LytTR family, sensor kinase